MRLENLVRFPGGIYLVTNLPLSNSFNTVPFRLYWFELLFPRERGKVNCRPVMFFELCFYFWF